MITIPQHSPLKWIWTEWKKTVNCEKSQIFNFAVSCFTGTPKRLSDLQIQIKNNRGVGATTNLKLFECPLQLIEFIVTGRLFLLTRWRFRMHLISLHYLQGNNFTFPRLLSRYDQYCSFFMFHIVRIKRSDVMERSIPPPPPKAESRLTNT